MDDPTAPAANPDALARDFLASGDPSVLGALFDATGPELFRVALALAPDVAAAEDALQETFLTALAILDRWDPERPVTPWLLGILRLKVHEARRSRRRRPDRVLLGAREALPVEPTPTEAGEDAARIRAAIDRLDEPYRSVAILRWRYGLSPAQIADARNEAPGTTSSILSRALDRLRRRLRGLPALFFGPRPPRGLEAVRRSVLAGAAGGAVVAGGAAFALGKVLAAATLVAAIGGGGWVLFRASGDEPGARPSRAADTGAGARQATLAAHPRDGARTRGADARDVVVGRVVDAEGRPVVGARVVAFPGERPDAVALDAGPAGGEAVSDARGHFAAPVETSGTFATLVVTAPGFPPTVRMGATVGVPVEVLVEAGATLVGRILSPEALPVAGARVRLRGLLGPARYERETTTDGAGGYRLDDLPPRYRTDPMHYGVHYGLDVRADGFATLVATTWLDLRAGRVARGDYVLQRGATVAGRVLDGETGRPVAGALVGLWGVDTRPVARPQGQRLDRMGAAWLPLAEVVAGRDGAFRLEHVPTRGFAAGARESGDDWSRTVIAAWAPGFVPNGPKAPMPTEETDALLDIRLWPAATVTGRVVDASGAGVPASYVWLDFGGDRWARSTPLLAPLGDAPTKGQGRTDAEGRYRLADLAASRAGPRVGRLHVSPPEGSWLAAPDGGVADVEVRAGESTTAPDVALDVRPHRTARLEVVDEGGRPVLDAHVGQWAWADRDGTIEVAEPEGWSRPGPIRVEAAGFAPEEVDVETSASEPPTRRVVMHPEHHLAGRVVTEDGRPVAGAGVFAVDAAVPVEQAVHPDRLTWTAGVGTGPDGGFRIDGLRPGPYRVVARYGYASLSSARGSRRMEVATADAATDAEDVVLRLPNSVPTEFGTLSCEVVDAATGRPAYPVTGWLERTDERLATGLGRPGGFDLGPVPAGTWTIHATSPGYVPAAVTGVAIRPGQESRVRVALERGVAVHGRVLLPPGVTAERRALVFRRVDTDAVGNLEDVADLGADGTYRRTGFVAGRYAVEVRWSYRPGWDALPPSTAPARLVLPEADGTITVPGGADEVELDLRLVGAVGVEIVIHDERLPIAWADEVPFNAERARFGAASRLTVLDARGVVRHAETGLWRGGNETVATLGLPPGAWRVRVDFPGEAGDERTIVLAADSPGERVEFGRPPPPRAPRNAPGKPLPK